MYVTKPVRRKPDYIKCEEDDLLYFFSFETISKIGFRKGQSARDGSYTDKNDGFLRRYMSWNCLKHSRIYKDGHRTQKRGLNKWQKAELERKEAI